MESLESATEYTQNREWLWEGKYYAVGMLKYTAEVHMYATMLQRVLPNLSSEVYLKYFVRYFVTYYMREHVEGSFEGG